MHAGEWAATPAKLAAFVNGPYWDKDAAMAAQKNDSLGWGHGGWTSPER